MSQEKCEVHGTILEPAEVPVSYGRTIIDKELIQARKKLFPNSRKTVSGGCVVGSSGRRAEVLFCEQCRVAESAWREANRPRKYHWAERLNSIRNSNQK